MWLLENNPSCSQLVDLDNCQDGLIYPIWLIIKSKLSNEIVFYMCSITIYERVCSMIFTHEKYPKVILANTDKLGTLSKIACVDKFASEESL